MLANREEREYKNKRGEKEYPLVIFRYGDQSILNHRREENEKREAHSDTHYKESNPKLF